jgi:hypothetical protein
VTSGLLLLPFSPERSPYRELSAQEEHSHPEDPFLSSSEVRDVSVQNHENCDMSVKANEVVASEACFKYANLQWRSSKGFGSRTADPCGITPFGPALSAV